MTLALIRNEPEEIVDTFSEGTGRIRLPVEPESYVHAPSDGWTGESFRIATVVPANPPAEGKVIIGRTITLVEGVPVETLILEDAPPASPPSEISRRQFFQVLAEPPYELITQAEALAAVQAGTIPAAFQAYIDALPADQQFAASMLLAGAATFEFAHPISVAFGTAQGWTEEQRAGLWHAGYVL